MKLKVEDVERLAARLSRTARPAVVLAAGLLALAGADVGRRALRRQALALKAEVANLDERVDEAEQAREENESSRETRAKELERFKAQIAKLTQTRRATYELGLETQEDRRLLEKQWEIMTTYLLIDPEAKKIHLMRGEQSLETYPIAYAPQAFGGDAKALPEVTQIVSKERYAHPERGKSEEVGGQLQWQPPQVGESVRANALGEYVIFTRGELVLHGPPKKAAEHKSFAHYCLGLSLPVARRLYQESYIGTKIRILRPDQAKR